MTRSSERIAETTRDIGRRLRAARTGASLTLSHVAGRAGVSEGFLSKLERGQAAASIANLIQLADALGLGLHELFPSEAAPAKTMVAVHRGGEGGLQEVVQALLGMVDLGELCPQSGFVGLHGAQRVRDGLAGLPAGEESKGRAGALDVGLFTFERFERIGEGATAERGVSLVAQVFNRFGGQLHGVVNILGGFPRANDFLGEDYGGRSRPARCRSQPASIAPRPEAATKRGRRLGNLEIGHLSSGILK
ncbi:MAG: helix-turn-helix domain-containing protein, partial [Reyranella sp.]|nr:helix-turn-helix domain-containing protein [Reyranella sp.]